MGLLVVGGTVRGALRISNYGVAVRARAVVRSDSVAVWGSVMDPRNRPPPGVFLKSRICLSADRDGVILRIVPLYPVMLCFVGLPDICVNDR